MNSGAARCDNQRYKQCNNQRNHAASVAVRMRDVQLISGNSLAPGLR